MSRFAPTSDAPPLEWALWYVGALGWRIFPLQPRAKTPLTPTGLHAATDDLTTIKRWWTANPRAGIGIPAGVNGLVIVDFDPRHGGEASYKQLLKEYARWQETAHVRSGGADRGLHFYFRSEEPWHARTVLPGVDVRAGATYVCAPPTIHPLTGRRYEWLVLPPVILPLPDCIASRLSQGPDEPNTGQPVHTIPEGQRHQYMLSLAGRMRRAGASVEAIRAALQTENEARFSPALDDEWVEKIVTWINTRPPGAPGPEGIAKGCPLSDEGNAQRLVTEYGERVRFDSTHKAWRRWDDRRWVLDHTGEVEWLCRQTVSHIHIAAQQETDSKAKEALAKWAHTSEGASRMEAMLKLARSTPDIVLTADDLDGDPYLLNCLNGVLDLRTGDLHEHDPLRPISKLCPWNYRADAPPPTMWQAFLDKVLPDPEMQRWLQILFGYCLSGLTGEQKLWLLWGPGSNGKSTALEVLRNLLGPDYAQVTPATLLIEKRPGQATNDVATLHGARVVMVSDLPKGYLDIDLIKQLTGDAKVRARHLYAESFEFTPQCKLLVSCNTRPTLNETTNAIKRRLEVSQWDEQIEESERVRDYYKVLLAQEGESIFRWAVQGYAMYQEEGRVPTPRSSREATSTYYSENDTLGDFLDECCERGPNQECRFSDLLSALHQWVSEQGMSIRRHSRQWLREELRHQQIASRTVAGVLLVDGVALRPQGPQAAGRQVEND